MVTDVAVGEGAMVSGFKLPKIVQYSNDLCKMHSLSLYQGYSKVQMFPTIPPFFI